MKLTQLFILGMTALFAESSAIPVAEGSQLTARQFRGCIGGSRDACFNAYLTSCNRGDRASFQICLGQISNYCQDVCPPIIAKKVVTPILDEQSGLAKRQGCVGGSLQTCIQSHQCFTGGPNAIQACLGQRGRFCQSVCPAAVKKDGMAEVNERSEVTKRQSCFGGTYQTCIQSHQCCSGGPNVIQPCLAQRARFCQSVCPATAKRNDGTALDKRSERTKRQDCVGGAVSSCFQFGASRCPQQNPIVIHACHGDAIRYCQSVCPAPAKREEIQLEASDVEKRQECPGGTAESCGQSSSAGCLHYAQQMRGGSPAYLQCMANRAEYCRGICPA